VNFDRVADIYDETRSLPEGVAERVASCIVDATNARPETRFLELGIGSGRIALPFIQRGFPYTGIDISRKMMDRLREKAPGPANLRLVEGDVTNLPFPDHSFDVVLSIHLLHLVPDWKAALREARRVLAPDGYIVTGGDGSLPGEPGSEIRRQWRALVEGAGVRLRPEHGSILNVESVLTSEGAWTANYRPAWWQGPVRPADLLREQRERVFSASWDVPDDVLQRVHGKMLTWVKERYGDLNEELPSKWEFIVSVSRFPRAERLSTP
jgi:SAM-dependent methyltransferase